MLADLHCSGLDNVEWSTEEVKSMFEGFTPSFGSRDEAGKPVGAIVGASVGGVVGLLAVSGLVAWFLRRRRKVSQPMHDATEVRESNARELDATGYRDSLPAKELDAHKGYEALPRQELEAGEPALREGG